MSFELAKSMSTALFDEVANTLARLSGVANEPSWQSLRGRRIRWRDGSRHLTLSFNHLALATSCTDDGEVDLTIEASAPALLRALIQSEAGWPADVQLLGNTQLAQQLFALIRSHLHGLTAPDFLSPLHTWLGADVASFLYTGAHGLQSALFDAATRFNDSMANHLRARTANATEIDVFAVAVDDLRLRLDRIEARIAAVAPKRDELARQQS